MVSYINSDRILSEFQEAKDVDAKLSAERDKMAAEINTMKNGIDSLYAELGRKQLIWSEQKKQETQAQLQTMYASFQQAQMDKFGEGGELAKLNEELLNPVLEKIDAAIKEVGTEGNYDFIFDTVNANIVYAKDDKFDITDLVLEKLK